MVFDSVYEMFDPLTTVRKQRFWDWFSGDDLHSRWTTRNIADTGTFAMENTVDGGFKITAGTSNSNSLSVIDFNGINQYSATGAVTIAVIKGNTTSNIGIKVGTNSDTAFSSNYSINGYESDFSANYHVGTKDGSTSTKTAGTSVYDTDWHTCKLELTSSNNKGTFDGTLEVTKTTNLPSTAQEPVVLAQTRTTAGTHSTNVRYLECYNT